jgi:hypothetical protein
MATTPFDWPDYLTLADELAKRTEEYCLRTAISRAYYYAYHLARKRVIDNGFIIVRGGDTHKQVWEKFDNSPEWACKKLHSLAKILKDKRQQADYDEVYPRIKDEFPEILNLTRKFALQLSELNVRLPVNTGVRNWNA